MCVGNRLLTNLFAYKRLTQEENVFKLTGELLLSASLNYKNPICFFENTLKVYRKLHETGKKRARDQMFIVKDARDNE